MTKREKVKAAIQSLIDCNELYTNTRELAQRFNVGRDTVSQVIKSDPRFQEWSKITTPDPAPTFDTVEDDTTLSITYHGEKWLSKEEIIEQFNLDTTVWKLDKVEYRGWEVTGKLKTNLWKSKNRYIALRFSRQVPQPIQQAIEQLATRVTWPKTPPLIKYKPGKCVMELSLFDVHLAKYCWKYLTGDNYDTKIAVKLMHDATHELLEYARPFDIDKVLLPIGNDFFQVDSWLGQTSNGTQVDCCDTRFSRAFQMGVDSLLAIINTCRNFGFVDCIYVPGNHDQATSFYLCEVLRAYYHNDSCVQIDTEFGTGHGSRKYRHFGKTLLGYVHGDTKMSPKESNLPLLMATEQPTAWANSIDRAWRLGHLHTKRTSIVPVGDIYAGVRIERIPSLSGTDEWHFKNGFVGNRRAAEAWIWSYENGCIAQFTSYAKNTE